MRWVWKNKPGKAKRDESGYALIMSLLVLFIVSLIGIALAVIGIQEFNLSARTKLMDQAYTIAEAGINRAMVQLKMDRSLTSSIPTGHTYGEEDNTPQWQIASPGESFGNGSYTVQIWQSELFPTQSSMKVIVATGAITRGDKTAERTIETRLASGAASDYDVSFDYCIYNGCEDSRGDAWPDVDFLAGNFTIDGSSAYPDTSLPEYAGMTPHYPKGAVYTRGTMNFPSRLAAGVNIYGDVVAEDNISLSNSYGLGVAGSGISIIEGNVIAGLDGTGSATVALTSYGWTGYTEDINISDGYLCAADDVDITCLTSISFGDSIDMAGIVAGGDVSCTSGGSWFLGSGTGINLGNIYAAGSIDIRSAADGDVTCIQTSSGRDATGLGAHFETKTRGGIHGYSETTPYPGFPIFTTGRCDLITNWNSEIKVTTVCAGTDNASFVGGTGVDIDAPSSETITGNIVSRGKVTVDTSSWSVTMNNITAGTDSATGTGGTGIDVSASGITIDAQDMTAQGSILVESYSFGGDFGNIWSGNTIDMYLGGLSVHGGNLSAVGNIDFDGIIPVGLGVSLGRAKANGNVRLNYELWWAPLGVITHRANGVEAGGTVTLRNYLGIGGLSYDNLQVNTLSGESASWTGADPSNDSIWAGGNVSLTSSGLGLNGGSCSGDIESYGTISTSNFSGTKHSGVAALQNWTPGVTQPGLPNMAPWDGYTVNVPGALSAVESDLGQSPPIVEKNTLLNIAGLSKLVDLVEPNWDYFLDSATKDQAANPDVPHVLRDRESWESPGDGGDWGEADDGKVDFVWDASTPYSSNETVYCGDTWDPGTGEEVYVDIYINTMDWAGEENEFEGTLVCKGNVCISASNSDWWTTSESTLNIVAGGDIEVTNAGTALLKEAGAQFHFWAVDDIVFSNNDFGLLGVDTFYGSFTAGNRLIYTSETFWQNVQFKWSRWGLDATAWLAPYTVYTWKEI